MTRVSPSKRERRRILDRLRRALRPPRILRPTRAGWCFFAIALGVGFAALNTGNNLLYLVLSLLLAFLVLSGVLSESALRGIEVRRRLPRELFAGESAYVGIEIRNAQRRVPAFAVIVEDCFADARGTRIERAPAAGRCFALRVGPGEAAHRGYGFVPSHRGSIELAGFRVTTRFPFGLFSKSRTLELRERAEVFPELERGAPPARAAREDSDDGRRAVRAPSGAEVASLRELEPGDSLRRVHWKASLRRQKLLVRDPQASESARIVVRLTASGTSTDDEFEARVRRAAAQVVDHIARGDEVGLQGDEGEIAPAAGDAQRRRLLGVLAHVERLPARNRAA